MNPIGRGTTLEELAAVVSEALASRGIDAVLSGGAVVSLDQAVAVATRQEVDLAQVSEWAGEEGMAARFEDFRRRLEGSASSG